MERVRLPSARFVLRGFGEEFGAEEVGESRERRADRLGVGGEIRTQLRAHLGDLIGTGDEPEERRVNSGEIAGLLDDLLDLDPGGDLPAVLGQAQRLLVAGDRGGHGGEGHIDGLPVGRGGGGQQIEGVADVLQREFDDVEVRMVEPGLVVVPVHAEAVAHRFERDPVDVVEVGIRFDLVESAQGLHGQLMAFREPGRGVVVEALRALEPEEQGEGRGEGEGGINVLFGDGIDGRRGSLLSHDHQPI